MKKWTLAHGLKPGPRSSVNISVFVLYLVTRRFLARHPYKMRPLQVNAAERRRAPFHTARFGQKQCVIVYLQLTWKWRSCVFGGYCFGPPCTITAIADNRGLLVLRFSVPQFFSAPIRTRPPSFWSSTLPLGRSLPKKMKRNRENDCKRITQHAASSYLTTHGTWHSQNNSRLSLPLLMTDLQPAGQLSINGQRALQAALLSAGICSYWVTQTEFPPGSNFW